MSTAKILIKYSTSKCNRELLEFLHSNVYDLNEKIKWSVVIVYPNITSKLDNRIKKLPALIINKTIITGNSSIKKHLLSITSRSVSKTSDTRSNSLKSYWDEEMYSGKDNEEEDTKVMETIRQRALEVTIDRQEQNKPKKKPSRITREDNVQIENVNADDISSMVKGDPMMEKFWANQECTPGFE